MRHNRALAVVGMATLLFTGLPSWAEDQPDAAALAKVLPEATVTLEQGLKASQLEGVTISAKFETDDGALQLSIYTMNRDQFTEVIIDHKAGTVDKSKAIIAGEDLKAAAEQGAVMSKARISLEYAVGNALRAMPGYRAVGVVPELENGHPVAITTLMRGQDVKKVTETLD
jgi:hypothetical protein